MARKKILYLGHGGTVGMLQKVQPDGSIVLVEPKTDIEFREAVEPVLSAFSSQCEIVYEFVTGEDSADMLFDRWVYLTHRIKRAEEEGFDGVGMTHGTNTLAQTATALALALHGTDPDRRACSIPTGITGAQNTIYVVGGDGRLNLENLFRTVLAAIECGSSDVLVNFNDWVLLGSRTIKIHESSFRAMDSPAQPERAGFIDRRGVSLHERYLRLSNNTSFGGKVAPAWSDEIHKLTMDVGVNPNHIEAILRLGLFKAVILESYGGGSVCTKAAYNFLPLIKKCTEELGIPVFISTSFPGGSVGTSQDEIALATIEAGGIPCYDTNHVAVGVKVRWALANGICQTIDDFRKLMATSYAGEVTPPS